MIWEILCVYWKQSSYMSNVLYTVMIGCVNTDYQKIELSLKEYIDM